MRPFRVRDPVHGFIGLRDDEVRLLDTQAMQRLRGIRQLAMANLVYPGAVHTRFEHSLGVTHVAGLMAEELLGDHREDIELVRKAALLHERDKIHELISAIIIRTDSDLVRILGQETCDRIANLLGKGHGQPALKSIVSGPLDADKQDYLLRDSHFCGVPYGVFDIHQLQRSLTLEGPEEEKALMIKSGGVHAVEQYALAKYYLTTNVYRHKVRLITDQMIGRAIVLGIDDDEIQELHDLYAFDNTDEFVQRYMTWDDARFMHEFCNGSNTKCALVLARLRDRNLLKRVFSVATKDFVAVEVRDILGDLGTPEYAGLRKDLEGSIAEKLSEVTENEVDADFVILNAFTIRSVREMSRNEESEILVIGEDEPRPFSEVSTLFASINVRYADAAVEVYAPIKWDSVTHKRQLQRQLKGPITEVITEGCKKHLKEKCIERKSI